MKPINISRPLTVYRAGPLISKEQVSITYLSSGICRIIVQFRQNLQPSLLASFPEGVIFQKTKVSLPPQSKSLVSNNRNYSSFPLHLCTKIFHISPPCKNNKPYLPNTNSKVPKLPVFCLLSFLKGVNSRLLRLLYHLYVSQCISVYVRVCVCLTNFLNS